MVLFDADLGAGKTTLTKGIARGLGVRETVTSPTYTIISEYPGRLTLHHVDLYRITGDEEIEGLGLRDILDGGGVSVVEWSDRMASGHPGAVIIRIEIGRGTERIFHIAGIDL